MQIQKYQPCKMMSRKKPVTFLPFPVIRACVILFRLNVPERRMREIYLDHNATTPVDPKVIEVMATTSRTLWANPSSGHRLGRLSAEALANCRASIARFIAARPGEILFTSGGTEADNLALIGVSRANRDRGRHILISSVEHHAVFESCDLLQREGFDVTTLPVDETGMVNPDDAARAIDNNTILISVMHANNEVGTIQPVSEIGRIARERGVLFHTDAAQSLGKIPVNVDDLNADLLTCSSHKIYGPKGVGFLYVRRGTRLTPLLIGGGQEQGARSGTENLPGIAGLALAMEIAGEGMEAEGTRLRRFRETILKGLVDHLEGVSANGHPTDRLPGTLSLSISGIGSADLLELLNRKGVYLSASAACTTDSITPSHVLAAMGVSQKQAAGTVRISLGRTNGEADIPEVVEAITSSVKQLRKDRS
jgi:cysteine desulfurase